MPPSARRERGSISREEILEGALELVRRETLDGLSMPKLARALGIGVTSIYWYYRSKEDLTEALTEAAAKLFRERVSALRSEHWGEQLRLLFTSIRDVLREDDLLCDLLFMRASRLNGDALTHVWPGVESCISAIVAAGFTQEEALHHYFALSHYTRGCVVLERQLSRAGMRADGPTPAPPTFPHLFELSKRHNLRGASDEAFAGGLMAIIEGMAARATAAR